ncbi:hypothetical protein [Pseudokineococcus lusitanus]|uniref:Uncharacterized protein n=1 Tax=Pseudokineococcus lusitanus TaxID=763993 RepID=A0A3N1HMB0_9ACTN|nr:hypothetical protein [Pseudokineococcus lusitanus]ROP43605.1 hypothetical protein EDC03_1198 [Pseudokineococcus lusitanus]
MRLQDMARRGAVALSVGALALGLGVSPAAASGTAPECSVQPLPPTRVSMDTPYKEVPVPVIGDCDVDVSVRVGIVDPRDQVDYVLEYDALTPVDDWPVTSSNRPGTYFFIGDPADTSVEVLPATTVVKYGARAGIRGERFGNQVELLVAGQYFNGVSDRYVPLRDRKATIQILGKDGKTWQFLRSVTLPQDGRVFYRFTNKYAATYRVVTWETDNIFSRTSAAVTVR